MSTAHADPFSASGAPMTRDHVACLRLAGLALLLGQAAFVAAYAILRISIEWPYSLSLPPQAMLARIAAAPSASFAGYYLYLLSTLTLIPAAACIAAALERSDDRLLGAGLRSLSGLAVATALAKALGITRWLFAMPRLAERYTDPDASAASREQLVLSYELLDAYAGKLGEHLGVQLLSALLVAVLALTLQRWGGAPKALTRCGLLVALLALPHEDLLGVDLGPVLIVSGLATLAWQLWVGFFFLSSARRGRRSDLDARASGARAFVHE